MWILPTHLRSVVEVTGYRVHAVDGEIGHIETLMIDNANWSVHYFIVDTRNWWFGKRVLISPLAVKAIDWFDHHVELNVRLEKPSGIDPRQLRGLHPTMRRRSNVLWSTSSPCRRRLSVS